MKSSSFFRPLSIAALSISFVACGDDAPSEPEFLDEPGGTLALSTTSRGLNLQPLQSLYGNATFAERDIEAASAAVIQLQTYSEFEQTQTGDRTAPRLENRMEALLDNDSIGPVIEGAERRYLVVDLQRLDRAWLNDWRGLERDTPDNRAQALSFQIRADQFDSDLQSEVQESILDALAAADGTIESLVLGVEMDRWYDASPGDWPYFVQWVHSVRDAAREAQPGIRVSAGINWLGFMANIVPDFAGDDGVVDFVAVRDAWNAVIDPLYFNVEAGTPALDFYAFAALADALSFSDSPEMVTWQHFAGVETMFDEYSDRAQIPVAWVSVGWLSLTESFEPAARYLERFLSFNGGYNVELVSWVRYVNLSETECRKYTGEGITATPAACYGGIYSRVPLFTQTGPLEAAFFGR